MERFTISLEDGLAAEFDAFMQARQYSNRSEAIRDLIRQRLEQERLAQAVRGAHCVACLTYVYNHHEFELARRLTEAHHQQHDLTLYSTHVHLDHDHCLEMVVLSGETARVRAFSDAVLAERGVRHGHIHMVPVEYDAASHGHGHGPAGQAHSHVRPRT